MNKEKCECLNLQCKKSVSEYDTEILHVTIFCVDCGAFISSMQCNKDWIEPKNISAYYYKLNNDLISELRNNIQKENEKLKEFVQHKDECQIVISGRVDYTRPCTCGLDEIMEGK